MAASAACAAASNRLPFTGLGVLAAAGAAQLKTTISASMTPEIRTKNFICHLRGLRARFSRNWDSAKLYLAPRTRVRCRVVHRYGGSMKRDHSGRDNLESIVIRDEVQSEAPALTSPGPETEVSVAAEVVTSGDIAAKPSELTPFMRQWSAAKRENPDALLFFRM